MKHAILSPSSSKRWLTCPGSVALTKGMKDKASNEANEGTAAHYLASEILLGNLLPCIFPGTLLLVDEEGKTTLADSVSPPDAPHYTVGDLIEPVMQYVDRVREYAGNGGVLFVEQGLDISGITGEPDAIGTSDSVILLLEDKELQVHDLKFGRGVKVDAEKNTQLMIYALAAWAEYSVLYGEDAFETFRLVIHQPRLDHLSEWTCTADELRVFRARAFDVAAAIWHGLETDEPNALCAGDHCRTTFCKAQATCPALAEFVKQTVEADFDVMPALPTPPDLTKTPLDLLREKMNAVDILEGFCKAVRAEVERRLNDAQNDPEFAKALGYKLVQGRAGHRKWKDEAKAVVGLESLGLTLDDIYVKELLSPAQADKLVKTKAKKEEVAKLVTQSAGSPSVAPLSDPRPMLTTGAASSDFDSMED